MRNGNSLTKRTLLGTFWMLIGSVGQALMQFLVLIVLARLLDPEAFGIVNAATVVITLSMMLSTLGVGPAIVQKEKISERHIKTAFTLSFILGVIFAIIIFTFSHNISYFFQTEKLTPILKMFSVIFIIQGTSLVAESLLQRELKFNVLVRIQIISYFIYGMVGISLAYLGLEEWSLAYAYLSHVIVKCLMTLYYKRSTVKIGFSVESFKELILFSGGYSLAQLSGEISLQGDNLIVGRYLGPESLGLYSRAYQLMVFPTNLFGKVMEKVLFPAMSKKQNENKSLQYAYIQGVKLVSILTLPTSLLMIILSENIVLFLFGEKWLEIVLPFQVLAAGLLFRTSYKISDALVNAKGAVYKRAFIKWIYATAVIIFAIIGQKFGLAGVALGILLAITINFIFMAELSIKLINCRRVEFIKAHFSSMVITIPVVILYPLNKIDILINLSPFLSLLINGFIYLLIMAICIFISPKYFLGDIGDKILKNVLLKIKHIKI